MSQTISVLFRFKVELGPVGGAILSYVAHTGRDREQLRDKLATVLAEVRKTGGKRYSRNVIVNFAAFVWASTIPAFLTMSEQDESSKLWKVNRTIHELVKDRVSLS
jgi:hypothetical protein